MNSSAVELLKALINGASSIEEIKRKLNVKDQQVNVLTKELDEQGFIDRIGEAVKFKQNAKSLLFQDISSKYDVVKILHDSNEQIFYLLTEPRTMDDLVRLSSLSLATIFRSLSELESVGAIVRDKDNGTVTIDKSREQQLFLFASLLKVETERKNFVEEYSEIIYQNHSKILKKVSKGKLAEGELTAFSVFPDYGIDYVTTHDYYVRRSSALRLEDVIIDAILVASKNSDKNAITVTILFYLKNKSKFDILNLRSVARTYGVSDIWLDIEGFIRDNKVKNSHLFLSREEFEEKARLYDIPSDLYTLPVAYPPLFEEIGRGLDREIEVYLLGGENMRIKNLKDRTKDCDILLRNQYSARTIVDTLENMGYKSTNEMKMSPEDVRINAFDILVHESRSRIDIFKESVGNKLYLSQRIMNRADIKEFNNLKLGILANEDVFLLKAVTDREGDVHDMARIIQSGNFSWNIVWDELEKQEHESRNDLYRPFLEQIDNLMEQTRIHPPFYKKLIRNVIDKQIEVLIRKGPQWLNDVIASLEGKDISEKVIRNRIDYLQKIKHLRKMGAEGGRVFIRARKGNVLNNPDINPKSFHEKLTENIHSLINRLNLPMRIERMATEIASEVTNSSKFIGFRPRNLATAIVFILIKQYSIERKTDDISRIANVSKPSIYGLSKDIVELLKKKRGLNLSY